MTPRLQDALDRVVKDLKLFGEIIPKSFEDDVWTIVDAVRIYANPNMQAAAEWEQRQRDEATTHCHRCCPHPTRR